MLVMVLKSLTRSTNSSECERSMKFQHGINLFYFLPMARGLLKACWRFFVICKPCYADWSGLNYLWPSCFPELIQLKLGDGAEGSVFLHFSLNIVPTPQHGAAFTCILTFKIPYFAAFWLCLYHIGKRNTRIWVMRQQSSGLLLNECKLIRYLKIL